MSIPNIVRDLVIAAALGCALAGFAGKASAQSSGQVKLDDVMVEAASKFGLSIRDFFTVCIGKQKICSKDGKIVSAYTGDFSSVGSFAGPKVPRYGNMLYVRGNLTPEPKGVWKFLIGSKFTDGIFSHVPRMNGDVLHGTKLPGKLGKAVKEKFGGRIIVDGGVQFITRAKIGGILGAGLKTFGFPTGNVLLRAGRELAKGPGGLIAGSGRTNPADPDGKNIPNGFVELRVPGTWKNPFNWTGTSLRETLVFMSQEGVLRMEGILSFNDDKRKPKREFTVLLETPVPGKSGFSFAWALRRMKIGFASPKVSLKDAMKLSAAMAAGGPGAASPFNALFKLKNPLNEMANLLPDIISIKNPKWKDYSLTKTSAPFPTADKFNLLFLSYLASHRVDVFDEDGNSKLQNVNGPHLQILGDLQVFGLNFAGVDFAVGPSVKGGIRLNAQTGKNKRKTRQRQARAAGAPFGGHASLSLEGGLVLRGGIDLPKPFGGRDFKVVINGDKALFSSPATCHFPFNLRFEAPVAKFDLNAITTVFKNAESFVPDGSTLVKCAGAIFYAMKDGVVYAFNETAELASLVVTDPAAAAAKIGDGVKLVGGKMAAAPGEAAEAALKIGGKLGKLGASVGGEVVGQLGNIGSGALKAGNAAGNAIKNIGGGIASGAKKVGCSLGLGGCKKKRRPPPGRKVAWQNLRGSGYDISASGNIAEKIWVLGGDYRFWLLEKGQSRFSKTLAYPSAASKTETRDFRKIAVGPREAILATDKNNKLYFSDGKRNGNRIKITPVKGVTATHVAVSTGVAWILSPNKTAGGQKIYRSKFDGTLKSLKFKLVSGGATTLAADRRGNAWIVADGWKIRKYTGSKWQDVAPILNAEAAKKTWINNITVDKYDRPWVSLGFASDAERMKLAKIFGGSLKLSSHNLFALTPNGWEQYQGGTQQLIARGAHIWTIGNGGKRNFYRAPLPEYIPEGPADDWRYTLASEASTKDDFCLYAEKPTSSRPSYVAQPVVLRACANTPLAQEQFHLQNVDSTYIRVVSTTTKLCVGLGLNRNRDGDQVQYLPCAAGDKGQHWLLTTKDGAYSLKSRHSAKCLRVAGGEAKKDSTLEQARCASTNVYKFAIGSLHKEKLASGIDSKPATFKTAPSSWSRVLQIKESSHCMSNNPKYTQSYGWACGRTNAAHQIRVIPLKAQPKFVWLYAPIQKKCVAANPIVLSMSALKSKAKVKLGIKVAATACNPNSPMQAWGLLPTGGGWFHLINRRYGTCLTRLAGKADPKKGYLLAKCQPTADSQRFRFYNVAAK